MDAEVLVPKLDSLARRLLRIESKKPFSLEQLKVDVDLQDIISNNLERAVQQCVDLCSHVVAELGGGTPATMGAGFDQLAMAGWIAPELAQKLKNAVGFRNLAVHQYEKIDWAIVYSICYKNVDDLKEFGRVISQRVGLKE